MNLALFRGPTINPHVSMDLEHIRRRLHRIKPFIMGLVGSAAIKSQGLFGIESLGTHFRKDTQSFVPSGLNFNVLRKRILLRDAPIRSEDGSRRCGSLKLG